MLLRKFRTDEGGNFATMLALVMVPVMGALTLAIDYTQMSRHRQAALNALDAANIATAWRVLQGDSEAELREYAKKFFEANLGPVDPMDTTLTVILPSQNTGGGTLKMTADLDYKPIFYPVFQALRGEENAKQTFKLDASSEVRLKNTIEVALVLDNSGSMDYRGSGSGKKRIDLLKIAAKELVSTLAGQAGMMKQVAEPVRFGIVPFASSVNIGAGFKNAPWMDTEGLSPIHHENFNWDTTTTAKKVSASGTGGFVKTGSSWGSETGQKVTRFSLYDAVGISWNGCVEMRPYPHGLTDTVPSYSNPETLFVPMFAPDETDKEVNGRYAYNNWRGDDVPRNNYSSAARQEYMPKYFNGGGSSTYNGRGPNQNCTTQPITPLTDVTTSAGLQSIENSIDAMRANGATNVPEGMAWGWRVVSGRAPFTEGRGDDERGNDKVVIVLTDGANTYYTPGSLGANDDAYNRSTYSNYGYAKSKRIFQGTSVSQTNYSNGNYTEAMNEQFAELCDNAKDGRIMVITVALDLDSRDRAENEQIEALRACASESRIRKDPVTGQPAKLFWNASGADLSDKFKEIADELSNLRFVG